MAWPGRAWLGGAWPGVARLGKARGLMAKRQPSSTEILAIALLAATVAAPIWLWVFT